MQAETHFKNLWGKPLVSSLCSKEARLIELNALTSLILATKTLNLVEEMKSWKSSWAKEML